MKSALAGGHGVLLRGFPIFRRPLRARRAVFLDRTASLRDHPLTHQPRADERIGGGARCPVVAVSHLPLPLKGKTCYLSAAAQHTPLMRASWHAVDPQRSDAVGNVFYAWTQVSHPLAAQRLTTLRSPHNIGPPVASHSPGLAAAACKRSVELAMAKPLDPLEPNFLMGVPTGAAAHGPASTSCTTRMREDSFMMQAALVHTSVLETRLSREAPLVHTLGPERTTRRAAVGSFGWPLRRLPVKGNAADSGLRLRRRGSFFRGSMRLSDFVTPSSSAPGGTLPESAARMRHERMRATSKFQPPPPPHPPPPPPAP